MAVAVHRAVHGGTDTIIIDGHDFSGQHIPDEFRINGIEGRRFRCQHPAMFCLAKDQGPIAEGIPAAVDSIIRASRKEGNRALHGVAWSFQCGKAPKCFIKSGEFRNVYKYGCL